MFIMSWGIVHSGVGINIFNADSPGEGLNDITPVSPVPGNPGSTVGEQRLYVFQAAANAWANYLDNKQELAVYTQMNPLDCGISSGVLGAAGATTAARDYPNAPQAATFYPIGLAQELAGQDLVEYPEIVAEFNSEVGSSSCLTGLSWWYGLSGQQPANTINFYHTVLHEIAHGLGFYTYVSASGVKLTTGFSQWNDHYMLHLMDGNTRKSWVDMSDLERAISGTSNQLVWGGAAVTAASSVIHAGKSQLGNVEMYAPFSYEQGSSVSHWDIDVNPDELMEPFSNSTSLDVLTKKLLCDIGWPAPSCNNSMPEEETPVSESEKQQPFLLRMLNVLLPALDSSSKE